MPKTYNLHGSIDQDMLDKFIEFLNDTPEEHVTVYLASGGGSAPIAAVLCEILSEPRFTLCAYDQISSSAFWLFFKAGCKKRLIHGCEGMMHQMTFTVELNEKGKPTGQIENTHQDVIDFYAKHSESFMLELNLTSKEKNMFREGFDVMFSPDMMREILSNQVHSTK